MYKCGYYPTDEEIGQPFNMRVLLNILNFLEMKGYEPWYSDKIGILWTTGDEVKSWLEVYG